MAEKKPSYWDQLRDPRWIGKAKRIRRRAGNKCEECGEENESLHVHHTYYERGRAPWEYDDETLRCWCTYCHGFFHDLKDQLSRLSGELDIQGFEWLVVCCKNLISRMRDARLRKTNPEYWESLHDFIKSHSASGVK